MAQIMKSFQVAVHVSRTPPSGAEVTGEIELFICFMVFTGEAAK